MNRITLRYCVIIITIITSCNSHVLNSDASEIYHEKPPLDSLEFYYPPSLNKKSNRSPAWDNFAQHWYSSTLYSFNEPILFHKFDSEIMYRLLWLRSFHEPVCFSIKLFKNNWYLRTKMLDNQPSFFPKGHEIYKLSTNNGPVNIIVDQTVKLNLLELTRLLRMFQKINFWSIPSIVKSEGATDGSLWILEGYKERKYHYIERENGNDGLFEIAKYLIKLGDLKIREESVY